MPHREELDLLTPDDVAAMLQIARQTLARWRHERRGPPSLRVGARVRYRAGDVTAWLAEQERAMPSTADRPSDRETATA